MSVPYDEQQVIGFVEDIQPLTTDLGRLAVNTARMQADATGYKDQPAIGYTASRKKHLAELTAELGGPPTIPPTIPPGHPPDPPGSIYWRGAFCIPDALPGSPYGDGRRIWTPAFGCYDAAWQDQIIAQTLARRYTWFVYQVCGWPYRRDYPELTLNTPRIRADLARLKAAGLRTIVAFPDDQGTDLSYLQDMADATQGLVDCVTGIFEANMLFMEPDGSYGAKAEIGVAHLLKQAHDLYPNAINAFHSSSQDNGGYGFGEKGFWTAVAPYTDVYFLQQSAWNHPYDQTVDRAADFTQRLIGGLNGWPVLKYGVVLFEETTTVTYRGEPESYGVGMIDRLLQDIVPHPTGYMDGGTA